MDLENKMLTEEDAKLPFATYTYEEGVGCRRFKLVTC
jgi:hypothetical protein